VAEPRRRSLPDLGEADRCLRDLVDGLERACAAGDRTQVRALTKGPARQRLLSVLAGLDAAGAHWEPARAELRWRPGRPPAGARAEPTEGPSAWVRLRLGDRSRERRGRRRTQAPGATVELAVLVETGTHPWRLVQAELIPDA